MTTSPDRLSTKVQAFRGKHGVPGIAAAIVTAGGIRVTAAGVRRRGREEPVGAEDPWHIGSCGKSLTAALYARLVESGRAGWEDSLAQRLSDVDPHPGWAAVTMTDLLTHFSGLPANPVKSERKTSFSRTESGPVQRTEAAARALAAPPPPQRGFLYSNVGYILAGAAIERITGVTYEESLRREILEPLGMSGAGFGAPTGDAPWGHRPRWVVFGKGPAVDPAGMSPPHPADNAPVMTPVGRLHVRLADWARFIRLFLHDGGDLLSAGSLERITTPPEGRKTSQGMGWALPTRADSPAAIYQLGSNLRWVAAAVVSRDRRRAVLVAVNDGRPGLFRPTVKLGTELLADH